MIVTGGGRGLGRAYALELSHRGAAVTVNDCDGDAARAVAAEISAEGGTAMSALHSVDDASAVDDMVAQTVARFGGLDGLVINAGVYHESLPWAEDARLAARAVRVNVLGAIHCLGSAARVMTANNRGSIVIASSAAALGSRQVMTYAATKGALASLMYSAALDLQDHGVRVNAIAPVALTRMTSNAVGRRVTRDGSAQPLLADIERRAPEQIAPLVAYLLSGAADGITGQFIRFDGRMLAVMPHASLTALAGVHADNWTAESIAEAFTGPLSDELQSFGVDGTRTSRSRSAPPNSRDV